MNKKSSIYFDEKMFKEFIQFVWHYQPKNRNWKSNCIKAWEKKYKVKEYVRVKK